MIEKSIAAILQVDKQARQQEEQGRKSAAGWRMLSPSVGGICKRRMKTA